MFVYNYIFSSEEDTNNIQHLSKIELTIQGKKYEVSKGALNPETTLVEYLRDILKLPGTKKMCLEGGCGACIVAATIPNPRTGHERLLAVNSCLVSIFTCHGWKIDTIEGIGGPVNGYNPIQKVLEQFNGTQCGYCSPGMVMNMYALKNSRKKLTMQNIENSFGSNICRCTGYRPILTAFKTLASDTSTKLLGICPGIKDIEELPCSVSECNTDCNNVPYAKNDILKFLTTDERKWIKVFKLIDLLNTLQKIGDDTYMLVAGNTAKGVYKEPLPLIYIDISEVKELSSYDLQNYNSLVLGANFTLNDTLSLFQKLATEINDFAYLRTLAEHIDLVAHVAVRNIGTIAGNLMMKHTHPEFQSDIFLLLETFKATLVIMDIQKNQVTKTPAEFLKFDMNKKIIKQIVFTSLSKQYQYETYKIMPRAQNAHAMINAGFLFKFNAQSLIENATIVYGNINPGFVHASNTEQYLKGKNLFNNDVIQGAVAQLLSEIKPDVRPPEPSPEYRKNAAVALFYKAVLKLAPDNKVSAKNKSGASKLQRPVSNGIQEYDTNNSIYPLTKPISKVEALAQTSGQAQYIDDIPDLSHQLYGAFVSTEAPPNSIITNVDPSKALSIPDIVAFIRDSDVPGENNYFPKDLGPGNTEEIFCSGKILYYSQPVGLLVGTNKKTVRDAVKLVNIKYQLASTKPLLTIKGILKSNAKDKIIKRSEVKAKNKGNDVFKKIKGSFDVPGQYHFYMETQCCLVVPIEDTIEMYTSTQWMDCNQIAAAQALNIDVNRVHVSVRRCGGAFGGKISRNSLLSCAAAVAAWKLRQPVRISMTLPNNMEIIGKRFPFYVDYEVDVNKNGIIQYLVCQMYSDIGTVNNEYEGLISLIREIFQSLYGFENFDITLNTAQTDLPTQTPMRAPGSFEAFGCMESIMDHIAYTLNLDPVEVRIANIKNDNLVLDYIKKARDWANIDQRKKDIEEFNKANTWKKKGISIVPMSFKLASVGPYTVIVSIFHGDGSVTITHGGIEIGQGINTKAIQVCAYKFEIPIEKVNCRPSITSASPNNFFTGGSYTAEGVCYGIDMATDELLRRMEPYKKDNQSWEQLVEECQKNFINLTAIAYYSNKAPFVEPYNIYGVCASEILLDVLTGQHQVTRVDLLEDVGQSLSPLIDIGQIEGAYVMGLGYYTTEELIYDQDSGKLLTNNTWRYKPPGAKDIPIDFRVKIPKGDNPKGVLQTKAVSEPPSCMTISAPLAIRHAVGSARIDSDSSASKWYPFDGPSTVEHTFMNCLNDKKHFTL